MISTNCVVTKCNFKKWRILGIYWNYQQNFLKNFNYNNKNTSKNLTKCQIFIRNQQEPTIEKYKNQKRIQNSGIFLITTIILKSYFYFIFLSLSKFRFVKLTLIETTYYYSIQKQNILKKFKKITIYLYIQQDKNAQQHHPNLKLKPVFVVSDIMKNDIITKTKLEYGNRNISK